MIYGRHLLFLDITVTRFSCISFCLSSVQMTSLVVRTVINTQRQVVTDYRTLYNTVYAAHAGYY